MGGRATDGIDAARVPRSERFVLESRVFDAPVTVQIARPARADAPAAALYLPADIGGSLGAVAAIARVLHGDAELPPCVVVSVVPALKPGQVLARMRGPSGELELMQRLLSGLREEIVPAVESRHACDPDRRVLIGHSWTGHLVLRALADGDQCFAGYLASSPALWRLGEHFGPFMQTLRTQAARRPRRVFLSCGELEQHPDIPRGEQFQMVDRVHQVARALAGVDGLSLRCALFAGESHASVCARALAHGLRWLIGKQPREAQHDWPPVPEHIESMLREHRVPSDAPWPALRRL